MRLLWAFLGFFTATEKFWRMLDVSGIVVFVGPNGSGKSLAAVASCLAALDGIPWACLDVDHRHHDAFRRHQGGCEACCRVTPRHWRAAGTDDVSGLRSVLCGRGLGLLVGGGSGERLVYSTVVLVDSDGADHPRFRGLVDYNQLLRLEHCDVLFDEVAGVSDASDSGSVPVQVVNWLHQLRKRDVRLRVTTPAYSRCSKPIRQVAQVVVDARSFAPSRRESGRLWRPRQAFVFVAYDAFQFEDFTSSTVRAEAAKGRGEKRSRMGRGLLWRPGHRAERTYNTLGQVLALGHVTDAGMCSNCGGNRPRPKCGCAPGAEHADRDTLRIVEKVSASGVRVRSVEAAEPPTPDALTA